MKKNSTLKFIFFSLSIFFALSSKAQQDTLRVMTYNVLHYGDGCQGSNTFLHTQLKTIVKYAHPDILGFVKAQAIKVTPTDNNGVSPFGFADSIINNALDADFPGRYSYCSLTNIAASSDMDILFYNQHKLGFVSVKTLCSLSEDFDLYKLFYKDPYLATTHDSTFLYVILNHTVSGSSPTGRDQQDTVIINKLKTIFYHLPNLISMGDFNTHSSLETGYMRYTNTSDTNFLFFDPPFNPDHILTYPISWESVPTDCPAELNTTTRASSSYPNSCGTSGGAKDWFIHIFLSAWATNNIDYLKYIPHSYTTLGNDGNRIGISENDSTSSPGKNISAPSNVINSIFQLSDKYPVMLDLAVTYDSTGISPTNPVTSVNSIKSETEKITVNNPVQKNIFLHFPANLIGQKCLMTCYDVCGRNLFSESFFITSTTENKFANLLPGTYILRLQIANSISLCRIVEM